MGKRAQRSSPKQQAVSRLLLDFAQTGGHIVGLKSGDEGVFGRLEEELVALRSANIAHEIIPGVSSACAAAGSGYSADSPPDRASDQFITGHDNNGQLPEDINLSALADPGATTIVFMGNVPLANYKSSSNSTVCRQIHLPF